MPIEGAEVELDSAWALSSNGQYPTAVTNKNGEYEFVEKVKADTYRIRASAEGFAWETYSRDGTVTGRFRGQGRYLSFGERACLKDLSH